ncbi:hypothetical protein Cadr_000003435 [Camelus dromedarius]|uniref:Uncharacterized protein n=1 Tax=Camelus dromedarius TaxID=9838 RepID=A0A5N4C460_CAMDR|nr:hypothetical protein Cadr_000003435 [Camelus dromedarius]
MPTQPTSCASPPGNPLGSQKRGETIKEIKENRRQEGSDLCRGLTTLIGTKAEPASLGPASCKANKGLPRRRDRTRYQQEGHHPQQHVANQRKTDILGRVPLPPPQLPAATDAILTRY